tara:strand:+ start:881 stop:1276 length:396 start_codon:yes stop_codon:yes gene_type:complete
MSAFSNYLEDQITGWIAGTSMTAPTATFVQLYNGNPTDTGTLGTALYSRVSIASGTGSWTRGTAGNGTITNASAFTITTSATASASADYVAVFDASATGNLLFYGLLSSAKTIAVGDEVKFNPSALTLTIA